VINIHRIAFFIMMLVGCSSDMSEMKSLVAAIERAPTASEEKKQLNDFMRALKKAESSINVTAHHEEKEVSIHNILPNIDDELIIYIVLSDGSKFVWEPKDNNNIFILLRD
jgi:PBP1b-binding outer membrane lipoprotein LpoB